MTLYEVLGLSDQATTSEIKAAHRVAVKRHHPDTGGDPEEFNRAQRAYFVLSDADRRARYDSTGVEDDEPASTEDQLAQSMIANLIMQFIDSTDDLDKTDVVASVRATLGAQRKSHDVVCQKIRQRLKRLDTLRSRLRPADASGIVDVLMVQRESELNAASLGEHKRLGALDRALSIIDKYQYQVARETPDETAIWSALKGVSVAPDG